MEKQLETPLKLKHDQEIKLEMNYPMSRVFIRTLTGCMDNVVDLIASVIRDSENQRLTELVWSSQEASILESNYPGKAKMMAEKAAGTAAAPIVKDGQLVEIEGITYKAVYTGPTYSNPVKFKMVDNTRLAFDLATAATKDIKFL